MADNVISKIKLPDNQEYILKDSNAARSNHTHTTSLAEDSTGTSSVSLKAGTKYKLTSGETSYTFTTPADANDKVTQTATTTSANYEILFSGTADNTNHTEGVRKTSTLTYNPNTKDLSTGGKINGYTLAAASARSVDNEIGNASTSTNLPTSKAVAAFVEGKGYVTSSGVTQVGTGAGLTGGTITTTGTISIATGGVTNDMLAGSIANGKLANSSISIAGTSVSLGSTLAAETLRTNLGLSNALHFRGIATVAITDGSTTNPTISGYDFSKKEAGDVIIDSVSAYEFVWTGSKWERLGPDGSYKSLQDAVTSPAASGNSISFIDTISQNNNGVINATKKTIPDASISTGGLITNIPQTFGGTKTFNGGAHFYGSINGSSLLYSGGAYDGGHNTIILHGDSAGVSGIGFTSQKATDSATITNINSPSDRAFIQYHAYGVTQAAEGAAPTLATSGEAGRLVIGVGNDAGDKILLQAPSHIDVMHTIGNANYVIPDTGNQTGSVGNATTPVYVEAGIIKAGTALKALAYKDSLTYSDVGAAAVNHTHSTQDLARPVALNGINDVTYQSLVNDIRANRLAFLPADQIIIEKTTDGGNTWTDAEISDSVKVGLFSQTRHSVQIPQINGEINTLCGIRITITAMKYNVPSGTPETQKYNYWNSNYVVTTERYNQLKNMYFWVSSGYNSIGIKVERATGGSPNNWNIIFDKSDYGMSGYSGNDIISFSQGVFGGGTNQTTNYWNYRLTFMSRGPGGSTTLNTNAITSKQNISEIRGYGDTYWTAGNNLASIDHLYSWDYGKNAIFPADIRPQANNTASLGASSLKWANVYATTFTGNLTGNATNVTGTVAIANGGTGKTTALDAANTLLSGLPTWTADPTDNTVLIRRDTAGSETYGKVTFATVWNYIKGKADSTYLKLTGGTITGRLTAPEINATHPMIVSTGKIYSSITGSNALIPAKTSMLFSDGIAIASPGLTVANDVGWIRMLGADENTGVLEIATGDDGGTSTGEKIVVRQYNTSNTIVKEAVLLDKQTGATSFPVSVTAPKFIGALTGHADSATVANYLYPFSDGTNTSGTTDIQILTTIQANDNIPRSVPFGVSLSHGNQSVGFGYFYPKSNQYGGWYIANYNGPSYAGLSNGTWTSYAFLTDKNYTNYTVAKTAGVTAVTWDSTNKKITRTINGTAADVVEFEGTSPITVTGAANKLTIAHNGNSGYKHIPSGGSSGQFLGWDSDGTAKWVANPNSDTKVTLAAITSGTAYYPVVGTGTGNAQRQIDTTGFAYKGTNGTTSAVGAAELTLGNSTASGTANNKQGKLTLYGSTAYTHTLLGAPTSARTITLPDATGTVELTNHIHGNLTHDGKITSTTTIANGDKLVIVDSDSKIIGSSITFDGSTTTKALTQKGTWETFNNYSHPTGDGNLHVPATGTTHNGQVLKAGSTAGSISWGTLSASDVGALAVGGNAVSATTATNLSAAPTITATGTATVNLAANTAYTLTVGGKSVVFKTPSDANTNTLVNYTLGETTKAYLMASQNAPTTTTTARAAHGDTGVYLTATAGEFSAVRHSYNVAGAERAYTHYNMTDQSIDFVFV